VCLTPTTPHPLIMSCWPPTLRWQYVGYLVCFFTFFTTCAYLGLAFVKHQKR
jgi:hypothetical protein